MRRTGAEEVPLFKIWIIFAVLPMADQVISKLMGHSKEIITMDVYGGGIIRSELSWSGVLSPSGFRQCH